MVQVMKEWEVEQIRQELGMPDLPVSVEASEDTKDLILYFQEDEESVFLRPVTAEDARAYASDDDSHGDGFFVGYQSS